MLQRTKYGAHFLSANLRACTFLPSFPLSSNSKSSIRRQNAVYRNPKISERRGIESRVHRHSPIATREYRYESDEPTPTTSLVSDNLSSDAVLICSLLSQSSGPTRNIDNLLKEFKEKLNSDLVLGILMNYRQLGRTNTLGFFSWAGVQMGFNFDDSLTEYMADFLGRRKLFDDLKCLLMTVSATKGRVSSRAISICIRFLGRQGRVKEALCLFDEMESELKCKPDNLVYNNMLYVLCKKESSEELIDIALTIFRQIKSPDTYSYSNILVGLCKFGRLESALEVFYEMGRVSLVPTRTATNVLIGELCGSSTNEDCIKKVRVSNCRRPFTILVPNVSSNSGSILSATQVFWAVHDLGLLPSAFIINRLISGLCQFNRIEEAVEILKVVEERKLSCVDESYTILIRAMCDARRVNEACQLFGRMVSQGLKPKLVIYNSLICLLCKLGSVEEAERLFEIMNKKRCVPDNVTYTALIHAHAVAHNWEAAYRLLIDMLGLGWCPHFHTYNYVDSLLKEHGRVDLSLKLEAKLETQVLYKHCKAGRLESAYEKLSSMLEKGLYPPIYVRDAFERAFQKSGKWKIAHDLLGRMDRTSEK